MTIFYSKNESFRVHADAARDMVPRVNALKLIASNPSIGPRSRDEGLPANAKAAVRSFIQRRPARPELQDVYVDTERLRSCVGLLMGRGACATSLLTLAFREGMKIASEVLGEEYVEARSGISYAGKTNKSWNGGVIPDGDTLLSAIAVMLEASRRLRQ